MDNEQENIYKQIQNAVLDSVNYTLVARACEAHAYKCTCTYSDNKNAKKKKRKKERKKKESQSTPLQQLTIEPFLKAL